MLRIVRRSSRRSFAVRAARRESKGCMETFFEMKSICGMIVDIGELVELLHLLFDWGQSGRILGLEVV